MENKFGKGMAGPGRPRGSVNRTTKMLRECILEAARLSGGGRDGMTAYLRRQADENPVAFMSLLGRVLPSTLAASSDDGSPLVVEIVKFCWEDGTVSASPQPMRLLNPPE